MMQIVSGGCLNNKTAGLPADEVLNMTLHDLSFGRIEIVREDIAELTIDEAVEVDLEHVKELHAFVLQHLKSPFGLMINRISSYAYSFEAQQKLADLEPLAAIAIVTRNQSGQLASEQVAEIYPEDGWNMRLFTEYQAAYDWLVDELKKADS